MRTHNAEISTQIGLLESRGRQSSPVVNETIRTGLDKSLEELV